VVDLEGWVSLTRDKFKIGEDEGPFLMPGPCPLTSTNLGVIMREAVSKLGLDDSKVSAHSLRYGGATMLAAAGLPQYILAYYGGWVKSSESLRLYSGPGADSVELVFAHMSRMTDGDLADARVRDQVRKAGRRHTERCKKSG
jgi:integrase